MIGEVKLLAYDAEPTNWKRCDGQVLATADYPALYALIGNTYGGDETNFALPDLRGRVPLHKGTGPGLNTFAIGQMAGSETVTLTNANNGMHGGHATGTTKVKADAAGVAVNTGSGLAGQSLPVANMQPYLAINFIICVSE